VPEKHLSVRWLLVLFSSKAFAIVQLKIEPPKGSDLWKPDNRNSQTKKALLSFFCQSN